MMRHRWPISFLLLIYLIAFISGSLSPSSAAETKGQLAASPCDLSASEDRFLSEARGIGRLIYDGRINCRDFRAIYDAHQAWSVSRDAESQRGNFSNIGEDGERVRQQFERDHHLNRADLHGLDIAWIDLTGAQLDGANISGSGVRGTVDGTTKRGIAYGINLTRARMTGAEIRSSIAKETLLRDALLIGVDFTNTDLSGGALYGADLRWANLTETTLSNLDLSGADLYGVTFEPKSGSLPNITGIASACNLEGMSYIGSPNQLGQLRSAFYAAGLDNQARQITYAIEHTRRVIDARGGVTSRLSSYGRLVAVEWTTGYGIYPFRPLIVLLALVPVFATIYFLGLLVPKSHSLWVNRPSGAINRTELDHWIPIKYVIRGRSSLRLWRYLRTASWFSLICAFRIGFREVNVGEWITRLQPREYVLGATGWCRTVAGVQSLISVYLLALLILSLFGRPFG